jgi:hypothetical protein
MESLNTAEAPSLIDSLPTFGREVRAHLKAVHAVADHDPNAERILQKLISECADCKSLFFSIDYAPIGGLDPAALAEQCDVEGASSEVSGRELFLRLRRRSDNAQIILQSSTSDDSDWTHAVVTLPDGTREERDFWDGETVSAIESLVDDNEPGKPLRLDGERDVELTEGAKRLWVTVGCISVFINAANDDSVTVQLFPRKDEMEEPLDEAYATHTAAAARAATT